MHAIDGLDRVVEVALLAELGGVDREVACSLHVVALAAFVGELLLGVASIDEHFYDS